MSDYNFVPPIWIVCPSEGLRLRIALAPELSDTISDGEQLQTIIRFQRFGSTPANGDFVEGIAAVATLAGLVIGIHRRIYVSWISPALNPALNYSRYFTTVLALPIAISCPPREYPAAVTLLETQRLGNPSDFLEDSDV